MGTITDEKSMRAVHQSGWGGNPHSVLTVGISSKPTPGPGELLIRVKAVSLNAGDGHMLRGRPYILRAAVGAAKIPGMDFSGVVVEAGASGTSGDEYFSVGSEVFGTMDTARGAFAEFVCVPKTSIALKPASLSFADAASVPTAGMTALQALRKGRLVQAETRVLINGAAGGVGCFAVQLAKSMGAHVTAVCSTKNVDLVRSLGADEVVDYKTTSVEAHLAEAGGDELLFDKIIDIVGSPVSRWRRLIVPEGGDLVCVSLPYPESECVPCVLCCVICSPWCLCCFSRKKSHPLMQEVSAADLEELAEMLEKGTIRAVIGERLVGIEAAPDAFARMGARGKVAGKVVVDMDVEK